MIKIKVVFQTMGKEWRIVQAIKENDFHIETRYIFVATRK